ncbi:hypothetical protein BC826DRAFT_276736 [Russula brevipes]|nr:hypothetical protein BC826DRAFT_276736 [Russula brevipes]
MNDSAPGLKSSSLVKAPNQALGASLRQLEVFHRSSGTGSHLEIPDGKRIKLSPISPIDGVQPASGTTSKGRKFDLDPSALKEDDGMSSETSVIDISDSDDFPEPHELVRSSVRSAGEANGSKRSPSRASDYSDPDMDALIRDAHLGSIISTGIDTAKIQNIAASKPIRGTLGYKGREEDCTVGLTTRTETTPSAGTMGLRFRPQVRIRGGGSFRSNQ